MFGPCDHLSHFFGELGPERGEVSALGDQIAVFADDSVHRAEVIWEPCGVECVGRNRYVFVGAQRCSNRVGDSTICRLEVVQDCGDGVGDRDERFTNRFWHRPDEGRDKLLAQARDVPLERAGVDVVDQRYRHVDRDAIVG